jgi:hypothetical protein
MRGGTAALQNLLGQPSACPRLQAQVFQGSFLQPMIGRAESMIALGAVADWQTPAIDAPIRPAKCAPT